MSIITVVPCQGPADRQCTRKRNIRLCKCQHQASAKSCSTKLILLNVSSSEFSRLIETIEVGYLTLRHTGRPHVRRRLCSALSRTRAGKAHRARVLVLLFLLSKYRKCLIRVTVHRTVYFAKAGNAARLAATPAGALAEFPHIAAGAPKDAAAASAAETDTSAAEAGAGSAAAAAAAPGAESPVADTTGWQGVVQKPR